MRQLLSQQSLQRPPLQHLRLRAHQSRCVVLSKGAVGAPSACKARRLTHSDDVLGDTVTVEVNMQACGGAKGGTWWQQAECLELRLAYRQAAAGHA